MTLYHSEKNQNKVFGKGLGVTPRSAGRCPEGTEGTGACQAEPFLRKVSPNKSRNTSVWVSRLRSIFIASIACFQGVSDLDPIGNGDSIGIGSDDSSVLSDCIDMIADIQGSL